MLADGQEYVSFDSPDDLVAKATYYLQHEEERVRIARAGQERALQHYSPRAWWQALCAAVGKAL
jgi:spore maturation protein CgeB